MSLVHIQPWDVGRYTPSELTMAAATADALIKRGI